MDYQILSGIRLIDSMRYGGYKNTTYALAELIDNSVESNAKNIYVMCKEKESSESSRMTLNEIAILDDGHGMNKEILRRSLKFGDGTHDGSKIGKFGMGLPNSSFSQCKRVEVYSWQKSSDNALYTYLDLNEIRENMTRVPVPTIKQIPIEWKKAVDNKLSNSGTLVIWKELDKCSFKKSKTLFKHSEQLVGRIYRKFIHDDKLSITFISFEQSASSIKKLDEDYNIKPNDPMYLMIPSTTPSPWDKKPMFKQYGDKAEFKHIIKFRNKEHVVIIRYSIADIDARQGDSPGSQEHGKHANFNLGVSLVRNKRELDLDASLVSPSILQERWWGVEVEFTSELDDFFGLTNNKQGALSFSDVANNLPRMFSSSNDKDEPQILKEIRDENPDRAEMIKLVRAITKNIGLMRSALGQERQGSRKSRHSEDDTKVDIAIHKRQKKHPTPSDDTEGKPDDELVTQYRKTLVDMGIESSVALEIARQSVKMRNSVTWLSKRLAGDQFFDVRSELGMTFITLNNSHKAYTNLMGILESIEGLEKNDALERLLRARDGLKLLIASWARYEIETQDPERKRNLERFRISWGTILDEFLQENHQ